ncbi:hypothetical protein D3C81_1950740 [compost metagenome]
MASLAVAYRMVASQAFRMLAYPLEDNNTRLLASLDTVAYPAVDMVVAFLLRAVRAPVAPEVLEVVSQQN